MYHALSVTRRIADDRFEMTLGINNIFNTKPPRISTGIGGALSTLGQSPAVSQYDWLGRRLFLAVKARLK
jgi:iron complex outermembrane receptor protein